MRILRVVRSLRWWFYPWQCHESVLHKPDHYRRQFPVLLRAMREAFDGMAAQIGAAITPTLRAVADAITAVVGVLP